MMALVIKNLLANAGDLRESLNPWVGKIRFLGEGNGNPSSILAWKIPWREEPGRLQSIEPQKVKHD